MHLSKKGFTLVELLIAISIVAILSGILIGSINIPKQMAKSRDVVRQEELAVVAGSLERYYADNNVYPPSVSDLVPDYIKAADLLPTTDPSGVAYLYQSSDNQNFCYCAVMENLDTPDVGTCTPGGNYNYCVENTF